MGRPTADGKPRDKLIQVRIDKHRKQILEAEKKRTGKPMSQIIVELIDKLDND